MLKKRILASSMASVMALTSMASVAVNAFAVDIDETTEQHTAKDLEAYIKDVEKEVKIADYGSISQEKYALALDYAKAHTSSSTSDKDATVAYQMLKATVDGLEMHTKDDLQKLINEVKSKAESSNVNNDDLNDAIYKSEPFDKLVDAYNNARYALNRSSKEINDAWEELDDAKNPEENKSVTKADFNSKYRAYEAQLKRLGDFETWRRGEVKDSGTAYDGLKTTWGALYNHIYSSYAEINDQYKRLNEVKGLVKTYDEDIVKACDYIEKSTNVLKGFKSDDVTAASSRDLDALVEKYKGRILYSSDAGAAAVKDVVDTIVSSGIQRADKNVTGGFTAAVFKNYDDKALDANSGDITNTAANRIWDYSQSKEISDSTKVNGDNKYTVSGGAYKISRAEAKVKCDTDWGLIYDPNLNGLGSGGWQVVGISAAITSTISGYTVPTSITAGDIRKVVNEYNKKDNVADGYKGFYFAKDKYYDLTECVDIPYTSSTSTDSDKIDPLYSDSKNYVDSFSLALTTADAGWGRYDLNDAHEELNGYADTAFEGNIRKDEDLIGKDYTHLWSEDSEVAPKETQWYGAAPNVAKALLLWNTYMKSANVTRNDNDTNKGRREDLVGKSGVGDALTRNKSLNDASRVVIRDKTPSADEFAIVYRYMKYAFDDVFEGDAPDASHTYKQLDELVDSSYDIFTNTREAALFSDSHNALETARKEAVTVVGQSHSAAAYNKNLDDESCYNTLKDAKEKLEKEYASFELSFGEVYDLINEGAKAVDEGNTRVTAEAVARLAKALVYVNPLVNSDGDEVTEIENNPFTDDNKNFVGYNRLYTATDDDTHKVTIDGVDVEFGKAKEGNKSHYEVKQAYDALKAQLDGTAVSTVKGDADGDGKVGSKDATAVLKHAAKMEGFVLETDSQLYKNADANGDGKVTAADATAILKHVAKIELIG